MPSVYRLPQTRLINDASFISTKTKQESNSILINITKYRLTFLEHIQWNLNKNKQHRELLIDNMF